MQEDGQSVTFDLPTQAQDPFRALWMHRLNRVLPVPTIILVATAAILGNRPWACVAIGMVYIAGNVANDQASRRDPEASPEGLTRHVAGFFPSLALAWVAGPDTAGWLLGVIPCFVGALAPSRRHRSFASAVFISAPILGSVLAGSSTGHVLMVGALMTCVALLSGGLFEIMHTVWEEAEDRREKLEETAEDLRVAVRIRETFLANITHELRTPLNGVLGATELLIESELDDDQRTLTEIARKSGWGLLGILDDILDTTRLASEGLTLQAMPFDPKAMSEELCELQRAALTRPLTINLQTHGLPEQVLGDPARLRQVLFNLIGNAVKFTPEGQVDVDLAWQDDVLHVSVQDTGEGIPKERLERLTDAFTQADNSTTRRHGGVGLGLHLCHTLIDGMGGRLQVESELGRGSRFSFEIQAPEAPQT